MIFTGIWFIILARLNHMMQLSSVMMQHLILLWIIRIHYLKIFRYFLKVSTIVIRQLKSQHHHRLQVSLKVFHTKIQLRLHQRLFRMQKRLLQFLMILLPVGVREYSIINIKIFIRNMSLMKLMHQN